MRVYGYLTSYLYRSIDAASLSVFRIGFGLLMFGSLIRFFIKGWIYDLYIAPKFMFKYYGFSWVQPWPEWGMYLHFGLLTLLTLLITFGLFYRVSIVLFFIGFTYIELLDKSTYLNHYYFISLLAFLMIFLPLSRHYSLDSWIRKKRSPKNKLDKTAKSQISKTLPAWTLYTLRGQIGSVYFFAGLAKLHPDWLFHAQPLKIWLSARTDFPLLGPFLDQAWVAYAMSWTGAIFDLSIPFLLSFRTTRPFAYLAVIIFHALTWGLLPQIGMFPWIMMFAALIFFSPSWPKKLLIKFKPKTVQKAINLHSDLELEKKETMPKWSKLGFSFLALYFMIQIFLPFRHFLYPGNVLWNEAGFRFSWRVMLMEKNGSVDFWVKDVANGKRYLVNPADYLLPYQRKQMSTQPDMILEFAHFLKNDFQKKGISDVEIYADATVSLNGRRNQRYINPKYDLAKVKNDFYPRTWVLPFQNTQIP